MLCGGAENIIHPSTRGCLREKSLVASSPRWLPFLQSGLRAKVTSTSFFLRVLTKQLPEVQANEKAQSSLGDDLRACFFIQEVGSLGTTEAGA